MSLLEKFVAANAAMARTHYRGIEQKSKDLCNSKRLHSLLMKTGQLKIQMTTYINTVKYEAIKVDIHICITNTYDICM